MYLHRISHYTQRVFELGLRKSYTIVKNKFRAYRLELKVRRKAYAQKAAHTWATIAAQNNLSEHFPVFLSTQKNKSISYINALYMNYFAKDKADQYVGQTFDLLGSGVCTFTSIPWHDDFRLQALNQDASTDFDSSTFYKDIRITPGSGYALVKDIKIPWELSRFQHLLVLGQAYYHTHDELYAQAFKKQIEDWLEQNPYLLGPNWVCPMDVGIRALNWVVAYHYFKLSRSVDNLFWERFACSLYDHMIYLENNWELYDHKTSNHYTSDLVGYLYLCWFFKDVSGVDKKLAWCHQEILREFDKQVFDEGTDYEGSTRYHILVTELFFHAYLMFQELGLPIPDKMYQKLTKMFSFIAWCDDIIIGDHDSGKVLYYGITDNIIDAMKALEKYHGIKHWQQFGLSIIKTNNLHISLRHHVYNARQPSGHHHNDVASVTLSYKNIPIVVDPGSYTYTASASWRNYFRSIENHSTFFIKNHEPVPIDEQLFVLDIQPQEWAYNQSAVQNLTTSHMLYKRFDLQAHRKIELVEQQIAITDWWQSDQKKEIPTCWNFTFAPGIELEYADGVWFVTHSNQKIMAVRSSDVGFEKVTGFYSPEYGVKQECWQLKGTKQLETNSTIKILFELL